MALAYFDTHGAAVAHAMERALKALCVERPEDPLRFAARLFSRIGQLAIEQQAQLPKWNPRNGRNSQFIKWLDALQNIESDLDIDI